MNIRDWLQTFTQREQWYLMGAALAVLLYVLVVLIWQPLAHQRDAMLARNVQVAQQLARVQAMASEVQQLQSKGTSHSNRNINQLINDSTNKFAIRPSRIQPNFRGESQIRFEDVAFSPLLRWLHYIENDQGMLIREVAINQGERGGLVKATIRLGQGG